MKVVRYILASLAWSFWMVFHHREIRRKAEAIIAMQDAFRSDMHDLETEVRIYAAQLDLEDAKWVELIGEKR